MARWKSSWKNRRESKRWISKNLIWASERCFKNIHEWEAKKRNCPPERKFNWSQMLFNWIRTVLECFLEILFFLFFRRNLIQIDLTPRADTTLCNFLSIQQKARTKNSLHSVSLHPSKLYENMKFLENHNFDTLSSILSVFEEDCLDGSRIDARLESYRYTLIVRRFHHFW